MFSSTFFSAAFWGDIALSDEEYNKFKDVVWKMKHKNNSMYELQVEDPGFGYNIPDSNYKKDIVCNSKTLKDKKYVKKIIKQKVREIKMCKTR